MSFVVSNRLSLLPPYVFVELDRLKQQAIERGEDIINLGIGDPDQPTPPIIIEALAEAAKVGENHRYPSGIGMPDFRKEVAAYYQRRHGVDFNPATEIMSLIGSKEGIGHLPLAFVNPGDVVLVPEPGYPVYNSSTIFAGGEPYPMPLTQENAFLPDLEAIPEAVYARTRLMFLNYPNNPTAAFATRDFFERVIAKARKHGFIVAHDAAYLDVSFGGRKALSFMEVPGAREVGIELHSLSKTFNMTGWRVGFAVGNPEVIAGLASLKANLDSGVFNAVQRAGIAALRNFDAVVPAINQTYETRLKAFSNGVAELGWTDYREPQGSFYVWLRTRNGLSSTDMTRELLQKCAVVTTPGNAFGAAGEGYFRIALTAKAERILEACQRMKKAGF
ncbi:MAG: LL-diaminopimelate aminotransferase [Candidatus Sumerlaeaceae bacterium]|nr:LL-diaminopimelate aminotransferase [Candidatus Sumerlaeaceae bacterium]